MKSFTLDLILAGLLATGLGCGTTPRPKPLRPQAEAPPPPAQQELEPRTCDFNQTICVRPAPRASTPRE